MKEIEKFLLEKILPVAVEALHNLRRSIRTPAAFFSQFREPGPLDAKASIIGVLMAVMLSVLSFSALHGANVALSYEFIAFITALNWMILVLCGASFWLGGRLIGGKADFFSVVNAFAYLAIFLVFLRVAELPALAVRIQALVDSCGTGSFSARVSGAISTSEASHDSNGLVLIGYIGFAIWSVKMLRAVNGFGLFRGILATVMSMAALSVMVAYIQEPAIFALVCGYVKH